MGVKISGSGENLKIRFEYDGAAKIAVEKSMIVAAVYPSNSQGGNKKFSQTDAGNRQIPIPAKLLPFF